MTKHLRVLFSAFPTASRSDELLAAQTYLGVLEDYSAEAVERSVKQFVTGKVSTHDGRFVPSAAELARNVREWDDVLRYIEAKRLAPPLASGILSVDFGHGMIDMTKLSLDEQDMVLRTGRAPDDLAIGHLTARLQRMGERPKRVFTSGDPVGQEDAA